jgi:hypothetical protein
MRRRKQSSFNVPALRDAAATSENGRFGINEVDAEDITAILAKP